MRWICQQYTNEVDILEGYPLCLCVISHAVPLTRSLFVCIRLTLPHSIAQLAATCLTLTNLRLACHLVQRQSSNTQSSAEVVGEHRIDVLNPHESAT